MANTEEVEMEKELYIAAFEGHVEFLQSDDRSNEYYLRKTSEKNNIIHIAIRHEHLEFIEATLNKFPTNYELISEGNSIKNTPLHIAAEVGNFNIVSLLYDKLLEMSNENPWREPNLKGDTPVHVALIHDNVKIAKFLLTKDPYLARIVNTNSKEAPLHLAIRQHVNFSESESIMVKIRQPINEGGAELEIQSAPEENMSSMIKYLVENESCVASWPDIDGTTPLHRAASLSIPYNLEITKLIIQHWPQSAEVCDASGKSILHLINKKKITSYQAGTDLLNVKQIYALRNLQDKQGNTPLHIAVQNKDTIMVRVLLESSTKLNINNSDGICATSVIQQQNFLQMLGHRVLTRDESEAAEGANIEYLKDKFSKIEKDLLLSKDSKGRNVLHKLMQIKNEARIKRVEFVKFIKEILGIFPGLLCQTDQFLNTPVHILVQNTDTNIYIIESQNLNNTQPSNNEGKSLWHSGLLLELLEICNDCILSSTGEAHNRPPWLVQNTNGNTPLHDAVMAKNKVLALKLLEYNEESAGRVNKRNETPLHLLARSPAYMELYVREDVEKFVKANVQAAYSADEEGLTPVLRAFKAENLATATLLCNACPDAAKFRDTNGQTIWHLLVRQSRGYFIYHLLRQEALRDLLSVQDKHGDTPLHLAITLNRFDIVRDFLKTWEGERELSNDRCWWLLNLLRFLNKGRDRESKGKNHWLVDLFKIENKAGITPGDLIAASTCLPPEIEKSIKYKYEMVGVRSVWGISTTQMESYVSTIGITAALIATITFTTAFTVPGGLFENKGTPIMLDKATFQVFLISDVIALCLSMMVLVCLLKIMATSNRRHTVVILDFSITLLLASFYATFVTFMMGPFRSIVLYQTLDRYSLNYYMLFAYSASHEISLRQVAYSLQKN